MTVKAVPGQWSSLVNGRPLSDYIVETCQAALAKFKHVIGESEIADSRYKTILLTRREGNPMLCFPSIPPFVQIQLSVADNANWYPGKIVYQFSHELCHLWVRRKSLTCTNVDQTFIWIEESICELASQEVEEAFARAASPLFLSKQAWLSHLQENLVEERPWENLNPARWSDYSGDLISTIELNLKGLVERQAVETRPLQREVAIAIKGIPDLWKAASTIASFEKYPNWTLSDFFAAWTWHTKSKRALKAICMIREKLVKPD